MAMTRQECEDMIRQKLKEIDEIQKQYNPEADYLNLTIWSKDKIYAAWNKYYDEDKDAPLDFYIWE